MGYLERGCDSSPIEGEYANKKEGLTTHLKGGLQLRDSTQIEELASH